jgi:hypothetical protein
VQSEELQRVPEAIEKGDTEELHVIVKSEVATSTLYTKEGINDPTLRETVIRLVCRNMNGDVTEIYDTEPTPSSSRESKNELCVWEVTPYYDGGWCTKQAYEPLCDGGQVNYTYIAAAFSGEEGCESFSMKSDFYQGDANKKDLEEYCLQSGLRRLTPFKEDLLVEDWRSPLTVDTYRIGLFDCGKLGVYSAHNYTHAWFDLNDPQALGDIVCSPFIKELRELSQCVQGRAAEHFDLYSVLEKGAYTGMSCEEYDTLADYIEDGINDMSEGHARKLTSPCTVDIPEYPCSGTGYIKRWNINWNT